MTNKPIHDRRRRTLRVPAVEQRAVPTAELAAFGQQEIGRWAEAVKRSGAQVD